jgi:hypothetical protein
VVGDVDIAVAAEDVEAEVDVGGAAVGVEIERDGQELVFVLGQTGLEYFEEVVERVHSNEWGWMGL